MLDNASYIFKGQLLQAYYDNYITLNAKDQKIIFLEHIKLYNNLSDTFINIPKGWNVVGNKYTINISNTYNCEGLFKINNKSNQQYFSTIDSIGIFGTYTKLSKRRSYFCKPRPQNVILLNCYNQCEINNEHCSAFLPLGCDSCTIMYSFNTGNISSNFCGGFVGIGKNITIKNSFNIGNVYGKESSGFVQYVELNCTLLNCYYTGNIGHESYIYFQTYIPKYRKNPILISNCYDTTNSSWTNVNLNKIDISNCYHTTIQHENIHNIQILSSEFEWSVDSVYPILKCFHKGVWNQLKYQDYRDIPMFKYESEIIEQNFKISYTIDVKRYCILIFYFKDNTHEELYTSNPNKTNNKLLLSKYKSVHETEQNTLDYLKTKQRNNPIIGIQTNHNAIIQTASSHQIFLNKDSILKVNPKTYLLSNILYRLLNPLYENMTVINIPKIEIVKPLKVKKSKITHETHKSDTMFQNMIQYKHSNAKQLPSLWTKSTTRYYPYLNFIIDNKYA